MYGRRISIGTKMNMEMPIDYSRAAAANYGYATLKEIKDAGHGFDGKDSENAREMSIDFIKVYEGITEWKE